MSFSPDISSSNLDKLKNYPDFMQSAIAKKFQRIADPSGDADGWPYLEDVKKANRYIEDLPPPAADIKNKDMHKFVDEIIQQRKQQHHNPDSDTTYTLRQLDHCYVMRQVRNSHRKAREVEAITYGTVYHYASSKSVRDTRFAEERNDKILSRKFLKISDDNFIPMNKIAQKGREHHTYETLHRLSALAEIMTENNWQSSFTVQTLPSRMHPKKTVKKNGKLVLVSNPKWNGTMPDEAHHWANEKWSNTRATLSNLGYEEGKDWMCVRTVEAHKDGTPHYNFVTIGCIKLLKKVNSILKEKYLYANDADGDEHGAIDRRIKVNYETGETACRKIASYAAKYALKNYLPEDLHKTTEHKLEHIKSVAWRQTWNIRAFSLIGFASIGLWKECRSKRHSSADIDIVKFAVETNWTAFQREFMRIGKQNIKPIHVMRVNKYQEQVKETVGHFMKETETIIAERISKAEITHIAHKITVIRSEPRGAKAGSEPSIQTVDPPPPDLTIIL